MFNTNSDSLYIASALVEEHDISLTELLRNMYELDPSTAETALNAVKWALEEQGKDEEEVERIVAVERVRQDFS